MYPLRTSTLQILAVCLLSLSSVQAFSQATSEPSPEDAGSPLNLLDQIDTGKSFGSFGGGGRQVELSGEFKVKEGTREGVLSITAKISPNWHIYSLTQPRGGPMASKLTVKKSDDFELAKKFTPDRDPTIHPPDVFDVPSEEHEGTVIWTAPIDLAEDKDPKALAIEVRYDGQVCEKEGKCIPISNRIITASFAGLIETPKSSNKYRADRSHTTITGYLEPKVAKPGDTIELVLTAEVEKNWHVYAYADRVPEKAVAQPTLIVLTKANNWPAKRPVASKEPIEHETGETSEPITRYFEDKVSWTVSLTVPNGADAGEYTIAGLIGYQACAKQCDFPMAASFTTTVRVAEQREEGQRPLEFSKFASYRKVAKEAETFSWEATAGTGFKFERPVYAYLGLAFLAGLILNVMPCVLPVIGLKIMSFVHQAGQSRWRVISLNIWYTVGMLAVFMAFATAAVVLKLFYHTSLSWASQFQNPAFTIPLAAIVFVFGLSLFGVWEIPIPGFVGSGKADKLAAQEGAVGAFFKGVLATILATPCSGPFLGVAVGFAVAAPVWLTYLSFACMGIGMAAPYLLIGCFPGMVNLLPKPGAWMETFKHLMGFVLMGTVVWFFSFISDKYLISTMVLLVGLAMGCWIIGRISITASFPQKARGWAKGIVVATLMGIFAFFWLGSPYELAWEPYSRVALDENLSEGRTVLVDFTADW